MRDLSVPHRIRQRQRWRSRILLLHILSEIGGNVSKHGKSRDVDTKDTRICKRLAKNLKTEYPEKKHMELLDEAAKLMGYAHFHELQSAEKRKL